MKTIFSVSLLLLFQTALFAQIDLPQLDSTPNHDIDSVYIKADRFLFLNDSVYYFIEDQIVLIPDTTDYYISKTSMKNTDAFYKNIKERMSKSSISKKLYDIIFAEHSIQQPIDEHESDTRFEAFKNHKINILRFKHLNIFGSNINDTTFSKTSSGIEIINKLHVNTRKRIIRRNVLFKENDSIRINGFTETERLLRRQAYIQDARIFVEKKDANTEVTVVTKDVFPYSFTYKPNKTNNALFGISNINIAGLGHELEYNYITQKEMEAYYRVNNIAGSFIDSEIDFSHHFKKEGIGAFLDKQFVTRETKYGGGLEVSDYKFGIINYQEHVDSIPKEAYYNRKKNDVWIGKSIKTGIASKFLGDNKQTNAIVSVRVNNEDFYSFDELINVDEKENLRFHDKNTVLVGLGLSSREYYKDRYVSNFGRTEDIPTGGSINAVIGLQNTQFENHKYLGLQYARGGYISHLGYINTRLSFGAFIRKRKLENSVLKLQTSYFSKLFLLGNYRGRIFSSFNFSQAINPYEDYHVVNETELGIRGVQDFFLKSTTKLNLQVESLLFTPISLAGFRMAVFSFIDYTMSNNSKSEFFNTDSFMSLGAGFRFRNDNLAISNIQIRFAAYPKLPLHGKNNGNIFISTTQPYDIRDFDIQSPEIVGF